MASKEPSRDPRLVSRNDPRLAHKQADENKKRMASQSPAGNRQPMQKVARPPITTNGSNSAADPRRRPSVDSPSDSRRGSAQSNGAGANATTSKSMNTTENGAPSSTTSSGPARTQTAPVANMGGGQSANADSVLSALPANPTFFDVYAASATITAKLSQARTDRDKATLSLKKARKEYETMSPYFEEFWAIKEQHTTAVNIAQRRWDSASNLVVLMEQENFQINALLATTIPQTTNESKMSQLEQQVISLKSDLTKERDLASELRSEISSLKADFENLKRKQGAHETRIAGELKSCQSKLDDFDHCLSAAVTTSHGKVPVQDTIDKLQVVENALSEMSIKVTQLEAKGSGDADGLGLVTFTPVTGPEEDPTEEEMGEIQQLWSHIQALHMATDNHKKQLDNLTTEDVVHQMIDVMSQHYPDAKNCQRTVEGMNAAIAELQNRVDQLKARVESGPNGTANDEVHKLRGDVDVLKTKATNYDNWISEAEAAIDNIGSKVDGMTKDVKNLQGGQLEIIERHDDAITRHEEAITRLGGA